MPRTHRLKGALDGLAGFAGQIAALERRFELLLEIILAALDFVDDRSLVATGDGGLEVEETLVGLAEERSVILRTAAEAGDFGAQLLDRFPAFVGALAKQLLEAAGALDVGGRVLVAGDAVDQRRGQRVENRIRPDGSSLKLQR